MENYKFRMFVFMKIIMNYVYYQENLKYHVL